MNSRPYTVHIYEEEAELISRWTLQYPNIETGGDFFGLWLNETEVVIQAVLGPGKNCRRTETSFFQDEEYLSKVGGQLTCDEGLCNIGSWHSHHTMDLPEPSRGDQDTVWKHLPTPGRFLLLIANIKIRREGPKVEMSFRLFESTGEKKVLSNMNCSILKGQSPVRANKELGKEITEGAEVFSQKTSYPELRLGKTEVKNHLRDTRPEKTVQQRYGRQEMEGRENGGKPQKALDIGPRDDQRPHRRKSTCDGLVTHYQYRNRYSQYHHRGHRRRRGDNYVVNHGYWLKPDVLHNGKQVMVLCHYDHRAGRCPECYDATLERRSDGQLYSVVPQGDPDCCCILL